MTSRHPLWFALALASLVGVSAWLRMPGFTQGGFANHDVGGILYNGMLLAAGKLPYVDSVEFKAPGTFYAAWLLAHGGRDIAAFQIAANLVALGSLITVAVGTRALWGPMAGIVAGTIYGLHDLVLDTMDANYVTWAQLPQILAVVLAMVASRNPRRVWVLWLLAGMAGCMGVLFKRPAAVALLATFAIAAWSGWTASSNDDAASRGRGALSAMGWVSLGVIFAAAPIAIHYTIHGAFEAWLDGFVLNKWGWRYVAQGSAIGLGSAPVEGVLSSAYFLALPLALATFAAARGCFNAKARPIVLMLLGWSVLALLAASIGFRFYKGYFLAAAAPLSMLAAAPCGLLGRAGPRPLPVRIIALLPALLLLARQGLLIESERVNRMRAHDQGGRVIAKRVRQVTGPGDRIWVWGWHLWDVYAFTGRLSSTRFYKTMELTTSANDSTWRHPRSPLHFREDLAAQTLLEELRADPPEYIVLGSAVATPLREFAALRAFLRERYVRDRAVRIGRVQFWRRRDHVPPHG